MTDADLPVAFAPPIVPYLGSPVPSTAGAAAHVLDLVHPSPDANANARRRDASLLQQRQQITGNTDSYSSGATISLNTSTGRRRRTTSFLAAASTDIIASTPPSSTTNNDNGSKGVGLYVHIPYCRRRCRYCDFAIVPIGGAAGAKAFAEGKTDDDVLSSDSNCDSGSNARAVDGFHKMDDAYRAALITELGLIRRTSSTITSSGGGDGITADDNGRIPLRSIYFGGGTPSLAPSSTLRSILSAIVDPENGPFYIPDRNSDTGDSSGIEITIEMDPGTFTEAKLMELRDAGFNRISLGVQSFDDNVLSTIGRVHRRADVFASIDMIRRVFGVDSNDSGDGEAHNTFSYSVDLISGLPGLSLAKWAETLETAVHLHPKPDHLSLYDLQIEEGTVFGKWYGINEGDDENIDDEEQRDALARTRSVPSLSIDSAQKVPSLPSPDECAYMYRYASGYLRSKGFEHYEISSYARPGKRSRHNQIYWEIGSTWYAIGLCATSSISGNRFARPRTMADYIDWVRQQEEIVDADKGFPGWLVADDNASGDDDERDDSDLFKDAILTKLRTKEGLDMHWVRRDVVDGEANVEALLRGTELALDMNLAKRDIADDGRDFLRLQDPDGFLFSNSIISQIFVELDKLE